MNETARHFQDCYDRGIEPEGGWAFGAALLQAELDHTPDSLGRLNMLLEQIRTRIQPERETFLATQDGRNFCALLAYYLMAHVARRSCARIEWHDYASAHRVLGPGLQLPVGSSSRLVAVCEDAGVALLPLGWVEDKLFDPTPTPRCRQYLAVVQSELDHAGPIVWAAAARLLGLLASWAMYTVSQGASLTPTVLQTSPDGERRIFVPIDDDTPEHMLARGRDALATLEGGVPFAAFAHETAVGPPGARACAIVVELRCHGDKPLAVSVAFPFRAADDPRGFAILDPQMAKSDLPTASAGLFDRAMQSGIREFEWPAGAWSQFHAGAPAEPDDDDDEGPVYADGLPAQVGDAVLSGGGLFPARVEEIVPTFAQGAELRLEICTGARRRVSADAVKEELVFVARKSADFRADGVRWLEDHARIGSPEHPMHGEAHARYALGNLLFHGFAVARDQERALDLWQGAADAGHAPAEREMGIFHLKGAAPGADPQKALVLLRRAADKDDARALRALGKAHETGQVGAPSLNKAVASYLRAAQLGDLGGLTQLARLHLEGKGVERDEAQAVAWLTRAAKGGRAEAQYRLALCYEEGWGVTPDRTEAIRYLKMAAGSDFPDAQKRLRELEEGA